MQFHWTFFQRIFGDTKNEFERLHTTIKTKFIPAIFGNNISDDEAVLFTLPVKKGGLAIMNPNEYCKRNFETSLKGSEKIISSIMLKENFNLQQHLEVISNAKKDLRNIKNNNDDDKLLKVLDNFPKERKRAIERSISSITKNSSSSSLTVMPLKRDHFDLSPNEFRDALSIRYQREPIYMPQRCDGCGKNEFNLDHALCCKTGGLITRRHNEIRDLLGEMCQKSWGNVVKEPIISEEEPCLRGDLAVRGVWEAQREALFDIRIVDTDAPSYVSRSVMSVLMNAEEEKKKKYINREQRHSTLTPLVISVDGVFALR